MDESVVKHLERQQVGALKLSEAIRIGAALRPQGRDFAPSNYRRGRSCALQAAVEAITGRLPEWTGECTATLGISEEFGQRICMMNDNTHTREQIADWLERRGL